MGTVCALVGAVMGVEVSGEEGEDGVGVTSSGAVLLTSMMLCSKALLVPPHRRQRRRTQ